MDHWLFRRLFRLDGSSTNRVPFLVSVCAAAAVSMGTACASGRGTDAVGPPIFVTPAGDRRQVEPDEVSERGLVVVSWNVHEGRGDIGRLVRMLRPAHVILLIQEATRQTTPRIAERLGLYAVYVPSMPNGEDGAGDDRGCAILSTLPIKDTASVELPWVYQRRVVVMGTIAARAGGTPVTLRVVSGHLDNRSGRKRQAEWLARWLEPYVVESAPMIVGADLNTWFGVKEGAVHAIDDVVPRVAECGDGPTFRFGLRLDHLFTSLPPSARRGCEVLPDALLSDHHPVVMRLFR